VAATNPSLILHDAFAVVARAVANRLGLPRVSVCSGHNVAPRRFTQMMEQDPYVRTAPECLRAVAVLREKYGIADASPFSYISTLSPLLNLYCEPPEFLTKDERPAFAPLAFFGSLLSAQDANRGGPDAPRRRSLRGNAEIRLFISFGTVVWRAFGGAHAADALRAMTSLTAACARMKNVRATVSLGRASLDALQVAALASANVTVETYVDQLDVLRRTDAFITHHGLNSTHEAIFHGVPMISHPFFWDQPALAARCQAFGVAEPLVAGLRSPIGDGDLRAALDRLATGEEAMQAALERARQWELDVMANRPTVLHQLEALMA